MKHAKLLDFMASKSNIGNFEVLKISKGECSKTVLYKQYGLYNIVSSVVVDKTETINAVCIPHKFIDILKGE